MHECSTWLISDLFGLGLSCLVSAPLWHVWTECSCLLFVSHGREWQSDIVHRNEIGGRPLCHLDSLPEFMYPYPDTDWSAAPCIYMCSLLPGRKKRVLPTATRKRRSEWKDTLFPTAIFFLLSRLYVSLMQFIRRKLQSHGTIALNTTNTKHLKQ